jgi:hypothetical protein
MGRMKDLFIDLQNQQLHSPDDTDWNAPETEDEPQPVAEQSDGKKLWIITSNKDGVDYRIWGYTYKQALELLPMIESF